MATVPVFAPDGTLGDIPETQLLAAVKAGGKPGVNMIAPDGTLGAVPSDRAGDAVRNGGKMVPFREQSHLGVLSQAVSAIGANLKGLIPSFSANSDSGPDYSGRVGAATKLNEQQKREDAADYAARRQAGYSAPYAVAAPLGEGLGVNVPHMEQAAREGNVGGVIGDAATLPLLMAATEGVGKGIGAAGDVSLHPAYQKALQVVKPAVRNVARAASDVVDPEITGVLSPRLAHGQRVLGRLANALEDKPQTTGSPIERDATLEPRNIPEFAGDERAAAPQPGAALERDATRQNVPFAGEEKPPLVDMTEKLATEIAAKRNAPQFTAGDRLRAKSLLKDALASSTADVIDQAVPGNNGAVKAEVDFYLKKGDVGSAETALDRAAKKANPDWIPLERQPVPSTNEIRARINAEAKIPAANSPADIQDTRAIQQEMNWNLQRHGWAAESEARREFIARNSTGTTKGELTQAFQDQRAAETAQTAGDHPDLDAQAQKMAKAERDAGTLPQGVTYVQRAQQLKDQLIASSKEAPSATEVTTQSRRARVRPAVSQPVQPGAEAAPGAATSIRVPGEERRYAATYQVRELADVQPSHNGVTFNENPRYKLVNDRNYSNAVNQGKVIDASTPGKFDPAYQITDNPDATNGPIVIDSEGHALGGNGRAMILQRTYRFNPQGADAYKQMLLDKAQQFGLDPARIQSMKQPVLVRQIDDLEFAKPEAKQNAVTDFNKKGTAELTPSERAIADSGRISQATLDDISSRLEDQGNQATLADILRGKSGQQVLERLINDGVLAPQERAAFVGESGLTDAGKDRISNLMIGRFFRDAAQIDSTPITLRNKLEKIAAPMAKLDRVPEWDLIPHVQQAIDLLEEARTHGAKIDDLLSQRGLFGESKYSPQAAALAKLLQGESGNALVKAVRQYAQDAADAHRPLLLGEKISPAQAFREAFAPAAGGEEDLTGTLQKSVDMARASKGLEGEQGRPFARPQSSTNYGKENRLVTEEEAKQARASLRSNLFRSHAGLDPTLLADAVKLGAYHFEAGAREFAAWSQKMTQELSQAIKPHLVEIWKAVAGITKGDMTGEMPVPTFYSKAERIALEKVPNAAPGDAILATLKNAGVKADELKWLGLDDLAGATKVTKQELLARIRDNGIRLEETTRGGPAESQLRALKAQRDKVYSENNRIWAESLRYADGSPTLFNAMQENDLFRGQRSPRELGEIINTMPAPIRDAARRFVETDRRIHELDAEMNKISTNSPPKSTKYEKYTLPGPRENYTELLMKLPRPAGEASAQAAYQAFAQKMMNKYAAGGQWAQKISAAEELERARLSEAVRSERGSSGVFNSGHFEEPNILAHVRFDDRIAPDGKKVLFVEEVQSDWHQKGKKEGYRGAPPQPITITSIEHGGGVHTVHFSDGTQSFVGYGTVGRAATDEGIREYYQGILGRKNNEIKRQYTSGVPEAPFKSDWHELAMKRMLRYAAENGYDRVAWTTGDQQAARYDLSKHVGKLEWHPKTTASDGRLFAFDHNGEIASEKQLSASELPDYIGKDAAEKLLAAPLEKSESGRRQWQTLSGVQLQLGGDWAKALYDRAIPNFLNKYGKKWGAKVGDTELDAGAGAADKRVLDTILREDFDTTWGDATPEERTQAIEIQHGGARHDPVVRRVAAGSVQHAGEWEVEYYTGGRQHLDYFRSEEGAAAFARDRSIKGTPVHSIDVTPAMKHSVLKEGQPIAKANQPLRDLEPALA